MATGYTAGFDKDDLRQLVAALKIEADGKELTKELRAGLKAAAEMGATAARAAIMSADLPGLPPSIRPDTRLQTPPLLVSIAEGIRVETSLGVRSAAVNIVAHGSQIARGFRAGARETNAAKGFWRHKVFGNSKKWVSQAGKPGWFESSIRRVGPVASRAAAEALEGVARRISDRTKG